MTNHRVGFFIICACFFMTSLDVTIVNVALPVMTTSLHSPLNQIIWVVNGYLLVYAALSVPAGRVADIFGQRATFVVGIAIFTLASALCGLAQSAFLLVGARLLQGVGSAFMISPSLALMPSVVPPERRGAAMGVYASTVALASVVGPLAGGVLVSILGWPGIFLINIPIGLALIIGSLVTIPHVKLAKPHSFDIVGIVLAALGLFAIVFAIVEGPAYNWGNVFGPVSIFALLAAGFVLLIVFAFWERYQSEPFLSLSIFKNWSFTGMVTVNGIGAFAIFGVVFLLTLYLESALGMSALVAGLTIMPEMVAAFIVGPFAGRMIDKIGGKLVLIFGLLCVALGLGLLAWVSATNASWLTFVVPLVITGVGLACTLSSVMGETLRCVSPPMMGTASGMLSMTRLVGGSIGVAVIVSVLQSNLFAAANSLAVSAIQQVPNNQRQAFTDYLTALVQNRGVSSTTLSLQLQQQAHQIYSQSFVSALHPTLIMVVSVLLVAVLLVLSVRRQATSQPKIEKVAPSASEKTEVSPVAQSAQ